MQAISTILQKLPPYNNKHKVIEARQTVSDIMREVLTAHKLFASDYDKIAFDFWDGNIYNTCKYLWNFCKKNIPYQVEEEKKQSTKSPGAILTHAAYRNYYVNEKNDCKHYSLFIGGILDGLVRKGKKINWAYRFASYSDTKTPEHVFIIVKDHGHEIWIDPVLNSFNEKLQPNYITDKKIKMLTRISGVGYPQNYPVNDLMTAANNEARPDLYNAILLLMKYGLMSASAKIYYARVSRFKKNKELYPQLIKALQTVQGAAVGGFFADVWRGIKKVTFAPMRAAYLSIVGLNVFGTATKLKASIYNTDGTFSAFKEKIKILWQDKFGGDFSALLNTVNDGANKKAILGRVKNSVGILPAAIAAWGAAAAAVIAAFAPVIAAAKNSYPANQQQIFDIDPATGQPYGSPPTGGGGLMQWLQDNPVLVAGGIAAVYFITKKKRAA